MERTHTIFLILSALSFSLLLFDASSFSGDMIWFVRIGLILMAPVLLSGLLFHRRPKKQVSVLKIIRVISVLFLILYYYLLWSTGTLAGWSDSEGRFWWPIMSRFSPILGYVFLSLSVRILTRNLKLLSQVDRLRG